MAITTVNKLPDYTNASQEVTSQSQNSLLSTPAPQIIAGGTEPAYQLHPIDVKDQSSMADFLNGYQDNLNNIENYDAFGGQKPADAIDSFMSGDTLGMKGEMPVAPKFEETFNTLRKDMGLDSVESSINEYKQMIREQENLLMQQRNSERGKTNRLGVIEGRIDQATRDRQEQISWLSSNVSYLTDVANSAYNFISMTMNFKQMDYNTAKEQYDTEFTRRLDIYKTLKQEAVDERDFKLRLAQQQQQVASAQLSMYADMITSGQVSWKDMTPDQRLQINKLEVQAGLPVGFTSSIKIPKDSTTLSVTNRTDANGNVYADILYIDPYTGATSVKHQLLGKVKVPSTGGGGSTAGERSATKDKNFLAQFEVGGSRERESTIAVIQRFDVDGAGSKTTISEADFYNAVDYLASREGISTQTAFSALNSIAKKHHYTIT